MMRVFIALSDILFQISNEVFLLATAIEVRVITPFILQRSAYFMTFFRALQSSCASKTFKHHLLEFL